MDNMQSYKMAVKRKVLILNKNYNRYSPEKL